MTFVLTPVQADVPPFIAFARESLIHIADETPGDFFAREKLLDAAFGEARFKKACERLREGRAPARGLALSMKQDHRLIGTVRLWHIDAGGVDALMLGPLAIDAAYRSQGLGRRMMAEALWRTQSFGHRTVLLVGDAPYYEAFGFSRRLTLRLEMPGPVEEERFLGLELAEGALRDARGLVAATGAFADRELLAA